MRTIINVKDAFAALSLFAVLLTGCDNRRTATIEGNITGGDGQLLVLEHLTDGAPRMVDTLRLTADGSFRFRPEVEAGPDFFSLRLGNQSISLVIDTLLNPVKISANANSLISSYEVGDSLNRELRDAVSLGNRLRGQIVAVNQTFNGGGMERQQARDSILTWVEHYKQNVLYKYIYSNPASPASYYLLFETVNGLVIFDANSPQDLRAFGAVATSWRFNYPASPRNKVLEKMTIEGQQRRRADVARAQRADSLANTIQIETRNFPELNLPNADDRATSLSALADGSGPVLLDFTAYYMSFSPAHNIALAEILKKYESKGLKIYQVCLDYDEHFWKTSSDNVPWTTVRDLSTGYDTQGNIQYSAAAMSYNVKSLPTTFIIGADGTLQARIEGDDAKLEAELKKINTQK
ncbi:MAG: redoxin domain-containing protein [Bacteroidales bacterium]|nr:redoxin domain-containing protein [Bacteroidales bacterium]